MPREATWEEFVAEGVLRSFVVRALSGRHQALLFKKRLAREVRYDNWIFLGEILKSSGFALAVRAKVMQEEVKEE